MGNLAVKAAMSVQKSVEGILKVIGDLKKEDSARFFDSMGRLFRGRQGYK